jgi:hypothetical protein
MEKSTTTGYPLLSCFFSKGFFLKEKFGRKNKKMGTVLSKMEMLSKALDILPATEEDIVLTGIISKIAERIAVLKKMERTLIEKYESVEKLEKQIKEEGFSPDDHTAYNDLLEWRATRYELEELR